MDNKLKSIGEIAKIVKVSVSTLRYYDEVGILKPEYIDEESRYRYYNENQISQLMRILELKRYGFNLDAIRSLLDETSISVILSAYEAKVKELELNAKDIEYAKDMLLNRISEIRDLDNENPIKILFIDDSDFFRSMIKGFLIKNGYKVYEASDGNDGVSKFIDIDPDIVIMDIGMPGLDGIEATRKIKDKSSEAKIIMCSARSQLDNILTSLVNGAVDFIPKPLNQDHILEAIHKALNEQVRIDVDSVKKIIEMNELKNTDKVLSLEQIMKIIQVLEGDNQDLIVKLINEITDI